MSNGTLLLTVSTDGTKIMEVIDGNDGTEGTAILMVQSKPSVLLVDTWHCPPKKVYRVVSCPTECDAPVPGIVHFFGGIGTATGNKSRNWYLKNLILE